MTEVLPAIPDGVRSSEAITRDHIQQWNSNNVLHDI